MYYLCHTKEETAPNTRALSSFFFINLTDKGCFTTDVEKNTPEIDFFRGFIVEFFRQVVVIMSDVEPRKVKRYLFSQGADLTFRVLLWSFFESECTSEDIKHEAIDRTTNAARGERGLAELGDALEGFGAVLVAAEGGEAHVALARWTEAYAGGGD